MFRRSLGYYLKHTSNIIRPNYRVSFMEYHNVISKSNTSIVKYINNVNFIHDYHHNRKGIEAYAYIDTYHISTDDTIVKEGIDEPRLQPHLHPPPITYRIYRDPYDHELNYIIGRLQNIKITRYDDYTIDINTCAKKVDIDKMVIKYNSSLVPGIAYHRCTIKFTYLLYHGTLLLIRLSLVCCILAACVYIMFPLLFLMLMFAHS